MKENRADKERDVSEGRENGADNNLKTGNRFPTCSAILAQLSFRGLVDTWWKTLRILPTKLARSGTSPLGLRRLERSANGQGGRWEFLGGRMKVWEGGR